MKILGIACFTVVTLALSPFITAQDLAIYKFKNANIGAYYLNGTYTPESNFHISYLQFSTHIGNLPASMKSLVEDALVPKNNGDYSAISLSLLNDLIPTNFEVTANLNLHLFGFGFALDTDNYISMGANVKANVYTVLGKEVFNYLANGYADGNEVHITSNSFAEVLAYHEFFGTYTHKIPKEHLIFSGSLKFLLGAYYANGALPEVKLATQSNTTTLRVADLSAKYPSEISPSPKGTGVGIDFAVSWKSPKVRYIDYPLNVSLSVNDLFSFISWDAPFNTIESNNINTQIDRSVINDLVNDFKFDKLFDKVKKAADDLKTIKDTVNLNFTTVLAPKIYFSSDVNLTQNHEVGVLYYVNIGRPSIPAHQKLGLSYVFSTDEKLFSFSVIPTLHISENATYYSTALGLNLNAGAFQMHLFTDHIEMSSDSLIRTASIGLGFSLNFGNATGNSQRRRRYNISLC